MVSPKFRPSTQSPIPWSLTAIFFYACFTLTILLQILEDQYMQVCFLHLTELLSHKYNNKEITQHGIEHLLFLPVHFHLSY